MTKAAISWVAARPGVSSVIVGARNPEQIRENAKAGEVNLPSDLQKELEEATEELKEKLGQDPDMWNAPEDSRYR